jgi:hypothetical protein
MLTYFEQARRSPPPLPRQPRLASYVQLTKFSVDYCYFFDFDVKHPSWRVYARCIFQFLIEEISQPKLFSALLKITERLGVGLYYHCQAL